VRLESTFLLEALDQKHAHSAVVKADSNAADQGRTL